jgi:hypothetical protein
LNVPKYVLQSPLTPPRFEYSPQQTILKHSRSEPLVQETKFRIL